MTELEPGQGPAPATAEPDPRQAAERSERALGRAVAGGLPLVAIVVALGLGVMAGIGPALLVLAGGAILGTISLLWASIRTLSGDAPLAESFSTLGGAAALTGGANERKRAALRALKDLEFEHSVGKIDDADYAEMVDRYRGEAKAIMRELDVEIEPLRGRAEELARDFLARQGLAQGPTATTGADDADDAGKDLDEDSAEERDDGVDADDKLLARPRNAQPTARLQCARCATSNEPDATFCKKCGSALQPRCGACGTRNEPDAAFCKKCGEKLRSEPKDPADVRA